MADNARELVETTAGDAPVAEPAYQRLGSFWAGRRDLMNDNGRGEGRVSTGIIPFLLVGFLFLNYLYGSISLLLLGSLVAVIWPLALASAVVSCIIFYRCNGISISTAVWSVFWFLTISGLALLVSGSFYDISFDGQTYHQEAIVQLSNGWNPYQDKVTNLFSVPVEALHAAINYYPKAPWIIASSYHLFFDDIEVGKASFWLLCTAAFVASYTALHAGLGFNRLIAALIALTIVANPIAISQSLSYYIDGHVYYLLVISFVCLYAGCGRKTASWDVYALFFMTTSLLVNMKTPAVAFSGFFILAFIGYSAFIAFRDRSQQIVRSAVLFSTGGAFALVLMGFHPYVSNTIAEGNPFYGVLGEDRIIETSPQRPADFEDLNQVGMFFRSVFSTSANPPWGSSKSSERKIPFAIDWPAEAKAFQNSDLRTGGFGPLFSGALLASLVLSVIAALVTGQWKKWTVATGLSVLLLLSSVIHPEAWWARYVPQFYLVPVIFAIFILLQSGSKPSRRLCSYSGILLLGTLLVNAAMGASFYLPFVSGHSESIERQLSTLQSNHQADGRVYEVFFGAFRSNRLRLQKEGIPFYELSQVESKHCTRVMGVPKSNAFVCEERAVVLSGGAALCSTANAVGDWENMTADQRGRLLERRNCIQVGEGIAAKIKLRQTLFSQLFLTTLDGEQVLLWTKNTHILAPPG